MIYMQNPYLSVMLLAEDAVNPSIVLITGSES